MVSIKADKRIAGKDLNAQRKMGKIPAVYYGPKTKSTPILVDEKELIKAWKAAGNTSVVVIKTDDEEVDSIFYDVTKHPITGRFEHVDFYTFEKGQKIHASIPLTFIGVSPAVKDLGGTLVKVIHELKVEGEPKNLPQSIEIDIGALVNLDSQITAKDLKLPSGVALLIGGDDVIASVAEFKEEKVEEAPVDLSQIEVEQKGKKEEEGIPADTEAPAKEEKA